MCKLFKPAFVFLLSLLASVAASAQVAITSVAPTPVCAGQSLTVDFTSTGLVNVDLDLQLVDAGGAITTLGTILIALDGNHNISGTVPAGFSGRYAVRLNSLTDSDQAPDSLTVNALPTLSALPAAVCSRLPANVTLTSSTGLGSTFIWTPVTQSGASGANAQAAPGGGMIGDVLVTDDRVNAGTITYDATAISAEGCSSAATPVVVTVNPDPMVSSTSPASAICSGSPVNLSLTASTPGTNTFTWTPTETGVDGAATEASFVSGPITDVVTTTTHETAGSVDYLVTPKSDLGCVGMASTVTVPVNPDPVVTSTAPVTPICSGASVNILLSASTAGANTFTWSSTQTDASGASQSAAFASGPINDVITAATDSTPGAVSYVITPKSVEGCLGMSDTFTVVVNPKPVVKTTSPAPICSGTTLNLSLSASTPGTNTFTWVATQNLVSGATNQSPAFASGPISSVLTATTNNTAGTVSYEVTAQSDAGCVGDPTTLTVTINPRPAMNVPVVPASICSRSPLNILLSATTPGANTFTWTPTQNGVVDATTASSFVSGPITDVVRTGDNATAGTVSYFVTPKSDVGCVGTGAMLPSITVNPDPDGSVTPALPTTICSGTTINTSLVATTAGPNKFIWEATQASVIGATQQSVYGAGAIINNTLFDTSNSAPGTVRYIITPMSGAGCIGIADTFNITVNPSPEVTSAAPATALCSGSMLNLSLAASTPGVDSFTWIPTPNGVNGATAQWPLFATGPITGNLTTTSNAAAGSVSYFVTPKSAAGCVGTSTTLTVNVNPAPSVSVSAAPPAFICSGTAYTIPVAGTTSSGANKYRWTVSSSPFVSGATGSSVFVAGPISNVLTLTPGQSQDTVSYTVRAQSAAGCIGADSTSYTVVVNSLPRLTKLLDSVCSGTQFSQPFLSTAPANGSYNWSVFGTNPNLTITTPTSGTGPIQNTFTYNNPAYGLSDTVKYSVTTFTGPAGTGCSSTDTFRIKVLPRPFVRDSTLTAICSGLPVSVALKSSVKDSNNVFFSWNYMGNTISNNGGQTSCIGCSNISQVLSSTSSVQDTAKYFVNASYSGCTSNQSAVIRVAVNPRPRITQLSPPAALCSGSPLTVGLVASAASSFTWTRNVTQGGATIVGSLSAADPNSTIRDTLTNLSNATDARVQYRVTPTSQIGACAGTDSVFTVEIKPKPVINLNNRTICSKDTAVINLAGGTSTVENATWQFTAFSAPGASGESSGSGTAGVIRQRLVNSSNSVRTFVVYSISVQTSSLACQSDLVRDTVFINPLPALIGTQTPDTSICSGSVLVYNLQTSTGTGTEYAWLKVGNFGAPGNPGSFQLVSNSLEDSLSTGGVLSTREVTYNITLKSSAGCFSDTSLQLRPRLKVTINPTPDTVSISVAPARICEGAEMLNFVARRTPVSPEKFAWGASTGAAYDVAGENALVSFPAPGTHTVFVTSNVPGFSCRSKPQPFQVSVDPGVARKPNVVRFDNSLVCLTGATGGTITGYQWGYDLKQNLDSVLLAGETFQSYVFTTLDTASRAYWVMATYAEGGCTYKAYFNRPATLGIGNVSTAASLPMTVYPNPARAQLNIELPRLSSRVQLEVIDLAGRRAMQTLSTSGSTMLDIANLTPGCYFLNCYQNGQRVATARFIKN